jgi:hypothetical protein
MSCGNCSHKLVCKYKPVSPCPIYPDDAALEECGTQPTDNQQPQHKISTRPCKQGYAKCVFDICFELCDTCTVKKPA